MISSLKKNVGKDVVFLCSVKWSFILKIIICGEIVVGYFIGVNEDCDCYFLI